MVDDGKGTLSGGVVQADGMRMDGMRVTSDLEEHGRNGRTRTAG